MARVIELEDMVTVGTLAEKLMLPATRLIGELLKNGIMATINERIDLDTAQIIVDELGLDVQLERSKSVQMPIAARQKNSQRAENAVARPPVVAVMGHVDHGKTSLLDKIRSSQVVKGEAGGITQHISAYQIEHSGRFITFLDTPGHEAFAAIREHGAHLTDIAIVVVAADDGIKPQTLEAIRFARKADVKIIVAVNKIDKEGADVNRVKQQLAEQELLPEEWGGDTVIAEVSAKTGQGIENLLDMILLVSDVEELVAVKEGPARGLIIESHMEQGKGATANALIEEGTMEVGDFIIAGNTYAKVRTLQGTDGKNIKSAGPSTPVIISGFKTLPEFGDEFTVAKSEKIARSAAERSFNEKNSSHTRNDMGSSELMRMISRKKELQSLRIVVKADVQGSLTSVIDSLKSLDTEEVAVQIVGSGVGTLTENDLHLAATSGAIIYGFNVAVPASVKRLASRDKVHIRSYKVIYELIDDVKEGLSNLLSPEVIETEQGRMIVRAVFKTTKTDVICGGEVTKGRLVVPALAKISRDGELLGEVEITGLKRGPQEVKEVLEGDMCGLSFRCSSKIELQDGDRIEVFTRTTVERTL